MPLFQQPQLQTFGEADMQDEELLAELGELENEAMQEAAAAGGVPAVAAAANTEADELALLQASMGGGGSLAAPEVPEADVSSVEVSEADMADPELAAELAALSGDMGSSDPTPAPAPRPASTSVLASSGSESTGVDADIARLTSALQAATAEGDQGKASKIKAFLDKKQKEKAASNSGASVPASAPRAAAPSAMPAPAVDKAQIANIEKQILLRRKAGAQAKKQNDKQKMQKYLREIRMLQAQKEKLEAAASAGVPAPASAPAPAPPVAPVAPVVAGGELPHVPEADVDSVQVTEEDLDDPELAAELAALGGDDAGGGGAVSAPAVAPAPAPAVAPAPVPAANKAQIANIEKQILLRRKAGAQAKKQNDRQKMQKYLREIRMLQAQKEKLEAAASAAVPAPASAPAPAPAPPVAPVAPVVAGGELPHVPEADVDSVQVTEEDLDDPELAAELAALGGDDAGVAAAAAAGGAGAGAGGAGGAGGGSVSAPAVAADVELPHVPEADVDNVDVNEEDLDDPELAAELAAMTDDDAGAAAPASTPAPAGVGLPHVPEADVDNVDVNEEDLDDPELAAELEAMTGDGSSGGIQEDDDELAPAPNAASAASAVQAPGASLEELEADLERIQKQMLDFAMKGEAPPPEILAEMKAAKARVEAFEAGPPALDPKFVANPFDVSLIESNEVLESENKRLTEKMLGFAEKGKVPPMEIINDMKALTFKITTLKGELEAGLDPQEYADRLQVAADRDDKILAALREAGRDEDAERVQERIVATRQEHAELLKHIMGLQSGSDAAAPAAGEDDDDLDGLSDPEDEGDSDMDVDARIAEFDAQIKQLKHEAVVLKKANKMEQARASYKRMKQIEKNKETFLVGVRATEQLQGVAEQQELDPRVLERQLEAAIKGAEDAMAAGDQELQAKYVKQAEILRNQWNALKGSLKKEAPKPEPVAQGPPPLTREQEKAYKDLHTRVLQQAKLAQSRAQEFEKQKQMAARKAALTYYRSDSNALKLIKAYHDQRRPDPPEYSTEERSYTVTKVFDQLPADKVEVTALTASLTPPIKNSMIRVLYDFEEANGEPVPVDGSDGTGDPASPEYNFSHMFRIERPMTKGWKSFERKLCRRKLFTFQVVEKGGWFGKESVKGVADWPNPKIATREEDRGKFPSTPGADDFGALRTRAEVTCDLPIYDPVDHEKQIGELKVRARVKVPLKFNPQDKSGGDVRSVVYSDPERQALVFEEDAQSLAAASPRSSLGAVPDSTAAEPAQQKRGGAAKAAARAPKKPAVAAQGAVKPTDGTVTREPEPQTVGGSAANLEAVAKKFKLPPVLLKQPDCVAAYAQSYMMLEQQMALIQLEIQENLAKPPGPNGLPKMVSPAKTKTFQECKTRKEKLEADMQSGALTAEAYAKTLGLLIKRDMRLIQALKHLKRDKETIVVAYRLKTLNEELVQTKGT